MTNDHPLALDNVWLNQSKFEDAERVYQESLVGTGGATGGSSASSLVNEIVQARQKIQKALTTPNSSGAVDVVVLDRLSLLEKENTDLKKVTQDLRKLVLKLEGRVTSLEKGAGIVSGSTTTTTNAQDDDEEEEDDDDDFDMFGDEDEETKAENEKIKQERLKAYADKKAKKPALIAKSNIVLDVKPWDDETDMKELEKCVRSIVMDGLLWGASKFEPVGYGIMKLQITCVVEDDKIGTDDLEEKIIGFEELIQSMDIAAFNKI